jgi:hypothetical protein
MSKVIFLCLNKSQPKMDEKKLIKFLFEFTAISLSIILLFAYLNSFDPNVYNWLPTLLTIVEFICGTVLGVGLIASYLIYVYFTMQLGF